MSNLYNNQWIGHAYDLLASLIWLPSKNKLYNQAVSIVDVKPGETVLELGCGTGFLTQKLVAKQAVVTSVDQSEGMLARARQRVAQAEFIQADILHYTDTRRYDYVMLFFVLHEFNATERATIINSAKNFLNKQGEIIICDFSIPDQGIMKNLFPRLLRLWESRHTIEMLENGFFAEIRNSKLKIHTHKKLYNGRVQLIRLKACAENVQ